MANKKRIDQIRQGEVLLVRVEKLPEGLQEKDTILAHGEMTGHKHQLVGKHVQVFTDKTGTQFVENRDGTTQLVHEEHHILKIPVGAFRVQIARELDIVGEVRKVTD